MRAARDLLDEQGAAGFSMVRLAERLGVTVMALYRHVADRADLERAVAEFVLADLTADPQRFESWRDGVTDWMHGLRDHCLRHPWLSGMLGTPTKIGPAWLAALVRLARVLEKAGLAPRDVAREIVRIARATTGTILFEVEAPVQQVKAGERALAALPPADRELWHVLDAQLASYSDDDLFADLVRDTLNRIEATLADSR